MVGSPLRTNDMSRIGRLHPELAACDVRAGNWAFCSYAHLVLLAARQVSATSACTTGRSWPSTRTEKRRHRGRASGVRKECPPYACSLPVGESNLSGLSARLGLGW